MTQVSLDELRKCEQEYRKVKAIRDPKWRADYAAIRIAVAHAEAGRIVYLQRGENGGDYYLLSDKQEELPATVCANHLGGKHGMETDRP